MLRTALVLATAAALAPPRPALRRSSTQLKAVWSDANAIKDYHNMLSGIVNERLDDTGGVVLGLEGDVFADAYAQLAPGTPDLRLNFGDALPDKLEGAESGADAEALGAEVAALEEKVSSLDGAVDKEEKLKSVAALSDARKKYDQALSAGEYPIYVICMSPDASKNLKRALDAVPDEKKDDLVFLQRGDMIEPTLKKRDLARERQTQAVLYYGLNEFGKIEDDRCSIGEDAMGQAKFAAESCVTGKWAGAVADRCRRAGFHIQEFFHRDWRRQMIEAVVFESAYNLVGAVHKHVPLSEVHEFFGDEVDDMLYEIQRGLRGHLAVTLLAGYEERMAAYAAAQKRSKTDNRLASCSGSSPYRNAFFYAISTDALSKSEAADGRKISMPDPSPFHTEYWEFARDNGLLAD